MKESTFESSEHDAQPGQGRRHALKAFGVAALAAAAGLPSATEATKNGKKRRRRKKNRNSGKHVCPECPTQDCTAEAARAAAERCTSQAAICEQEVRRRCRLNNGPGDDGEAECLAEVLPCCQQLGTCDVPAFFACIVSESETNL